jgi:hypothetical protein
MKEISEPYGKLQILELYNLYFLPDIMQMIKIKEDEMSVTCSTYETMRTAWNLYSENMKERDHFSCLDKHR